ncbi:MAG: precorrin-3B C(17)-methyltransferase [Clostridia bacterium]|nr:precorrin-3B C(17)-methyltransferase [Clostridia bacterium]
MNKLFVVGLGPGSAIGMTGQAQLALAEAEAIFGYTKYVELVQPLFPDKQYFATAMHSEIERCKMALQAAAENTVAMVCSGDAGVYGMAGLLYELLPAYPNVEIEVVPGVTAAQSGAAVLGAPLMQDYAVISLSDLLVPWQLIEKRLQGAAMGDFVIVLYNPASHKRKEHLRSACDIVLANKDPETVCGIVQNIGRKGEQSRLLTLAELRDTEVDMFTTVFIGNSKTRLLNGKMVNLRGYEQKR